MDSGRARWDERHTARGRAEPTAPEALAGRDDLAALLPDAGRALDIACGVGGQTLWLAGRGLQVVALDVSPAAIRLTTEAAAAHGLAGRVDAVVHDLDGGLPVDLGRFDVVVCQRFRDTALYAPIVQLLAPGGLAIVTVLSAVGLDGEPRRFHAPPGELRAAFAAAADAPLDAPLDVLLDVLLDVEAHGLASIVFRRR